MKTLDLFLRGFADGASLGYDTADEQWAAYSRQLSDNERARIEAQGYIAGHAEGKAFAVTFRGEEELP